MHLFLASQNNCTLKLYENFMHELLFLHHNSINSKDTVVQFSARILLEEKGKLCN